MFGEPLLTCALAEFVTAKKEKRHITANIVDFFILISQVSGEFHILFATTTKKSLLRCAEFSEFIKTRTS